MLDETNGINNEYEFVRYLNNKKIDKLNPIFRELITKLFSNVQDNMSIKCWKNYYKQKTDIYIRINNITKRISIKKGIKNSIHTERISDFIHFLIVNKVDRKIIIEYLKYHYADGTTNGKGIKRMTAEEYKRNNQSSIDEINKVFNNESLLTKAIDRFVLKGNNSFYTIDAIIHGTINDFLWITKEDIKNIILSKKNEYSTAVHFGPLTYQPKNRCLNYNSRYEKDRYSIQLKWYNLESDIIEQMNNKLVKN